MPISAANLKTLRVNPDWATLPLFDRTGWTKVRFGDVVRVLKEQVDPTSGEVERYVAGEHMDSENVHIRRWGIVGDGYLGPAFIRRFRRGQVLYGSRRTYLKKVAVAEWDGVTANTTFVLEAVEGRLLQGLLPWLMLSERFTKHSVQESKGSTNPYINWPDIAKFEFDLPPIDQQRRIAEMLWGADGLLQASLKLRADLEAAFRATVHDVFFAHGASRRDTLFDPKWKTAELQEITSPDAPIRYGIVQVGQFCEEGVPTIAINNLAGDFIAGVHRTAPGIEARFAGSRIEPNDLLIAVKGATAGKVGIVPGHFRGNISRDLARIRCSPEVDPRLLLHLLQSDRYQAYINTHAVGSTRKEISIHRLRRFEIALPPEDVAAHLLYQIERLEALAVSSRAHIAKTDELRRAITREVV